MASEKRLIDAYSLIGKALEEKRFVFQKKDFLNEQYVIDTVYRDLGEFILSAPTVDAVEVVRCKDCKHYKNAEGCKPLCQKFEGLYGYPKEDDFCSYGERRTT